MTNPILLVLRDPALRIAALLMLLLGAVVCSFGPYISLLAVETFGLGDKGFAALLVVSTLLSVSASVYAGIRADQTGNRRGVSMTALLVMVAALVLMTVAPGWVTFIIAHALLLPLASGLFGQLFALGRMAASTHPARDGDAIMAVIRALFSLPFIAVLPLWSLAFAAGVDILWIYPVGLALTLVMLGLAARYWPRDGATRWGDAPSGLSVASALREIAAPGLMGRVLALGAVNCADAVYVAILALLMVPAVGRGPADVALFFGLVAGAEVPFMLILPLLTRGIARTRLILAGTLIYAVHLGCLPLLAGTGWVWWLILPASLGGGILLTVPIAYLQDLLAARPGTGSSLMALQRLVGQLLAAGCFALGTALAGYGLVAALATGTALIGAVGLALADRAR